MNYPGFGSTCRNNLSQLRRSTKGRRKGCERQKKIIIFSEKITRRKRPKRKEAPTGRKNEETKTQQEKINYSKFNLSNTTLKKLFLIPSAALSVLGTVSAFAQDAAAATETVVAETQIAGDSMHHVMMQKFLEGGWEWMLPVLLCLVIGLAVAIERILYLSLSTINSKKLIASVEEALKNGGIEAAKEVCRNTRGPIASIYYQGLDRYDQGLDAVEKAVVSYGSVQTGQMESGLSWIGLFIALSPMLGFMGTVVGMIAAFDAIQAAGDISPTLVAGGIKVALLTTLMGLIAAVVLQLFYNYIVSKIDSLVNDMEDSSITLMDILTAYNKK